MITFRTLADVTENRQIVVCLPPETPIGRVELEVRIALQDDAAVAIGTLRRHFGAIHSGDGRSADNERIDRDLARAYANGQD
jgi:hypothetical protein